MAELDPRTYLAAERTLLAWIRTGLAMMGFGFVVARFGMFLRELASARSEHLAPHGKFSLAIGVALVTMGVVTNLLAGLRHRRLLRRIEKGEPIGDASVGIFFSIILAGLGVAMAIYLVVAQQAV